MSWGGEKIRNEEKECNKNGERNQIMNQNERTERIQSKNLKKDPKRKKREKNWEKNWKKMVIDLRENVFGAKCPDLLVRCSVFGTWFHFWCIICNIGRCFSFYLGVDRL